MFVLGQAYTKLQLPVQSHTIPILPLISKQNRRRAEDDIQKEFKSISNLTAAAVEVVNTVSVDHHHDGIM